MLILAIYDLICYYSLRLLMWTTLLTLLLCQSCALKDKDELISFWTFLSLLAQYLLFVFWHCQSSFVICSATMCLFEFLPNLCLSCLFTDCWTYLGFLVLRLYWFAFSVRHRMGTCFAKWVMHSVLSYFNYDLLPVVLVSFITLSRQTNICICSSICNFSEMFSLERQLTIQYGDKTTTTVLSATICDTGYIQNFIGFVKCEVM